jgi:hypothetical protein
LFKPVRTSNVLRFKNGDGRPPFNCIAEKICIRKKEIHKFKFKFEQVITMGSRLSKGSTGE